MKKKGSMTPPKLCNSSITKSKGNEVVEIPYK
jgi:hypothetical protein